MTDRHDHYRELCAEDAAGRLSEGDYTELLQHLRGCQECQRLHRDFVHLSRNIMPTVAELYGPKRNVDPTRKRQLLEIARSEGLSFDLPQERRKQSFKKWALFVSWAASLIAAVLVTAVISRHSSTLDVGSPRTRSTSNRTSVPLSERPANKPSGVIERDAEERKELARLRNIVENRRRQLKESRRLKAEYPPKNLLGDRNLQVLNIFPRDELGNPRREFGRLFYSKGKQMELYAFDLDDPQKPNADNAFYVWGELVEIAKSNSSPVVPLGKLSLDSVKENRWALVIRDPGLLERLAAIFVTVESTQNRVVGPTGKSMLFVSLNRWRSHP